MVHFLFSTTRVVGFLISTTCVVHLISSTTCVVGLLISTTCVVDCPRTLIFLLLRISRAKTESCLSLAESTPFWDDVGLRLY